VFFSDTITGMNVSERKQTNLNEPYHIVRFREHSAKRRGEREGEEENGNVRDRNTNDAFEPKREAGREIRERAIAKHIEQSTATKENMIRVGHHSNDSPNGDAECKRHHNIHHTH